MVLIMKTDSFMKVNKMEIRFILEEKSEINDQISEYDYLWKKLGKQDKIFTI